MDLMVCIKVLYVFVVMLSALDLMLLIILCEAIRAVRICFHWCLTQKC